MKLKIYIKHRTKESLGFTAIFGWNLHDMYMFFLNQEPTYPIGSRPTPPWLSPDVIAHRNKINGIIASTTIILSLLLLIAALRCYKKYHRRVLALFLFILALLCINVLLFSYIFPTFFPDLIGPLPPIVGISGITPMVNIR